MLAVQKLQIIPKCQQNSVIFQFFLLNKLSAFVRGKETPKLTRAKRVVKSSDLAGG